MPCGGQTSPRVRIPPSPLQINAVGPASLRLQNAARCRLLLVSIKVYEIRELPVSNMSRYFAPTFLSLVLAPCTGALAEEQQSHRLVIKSELLGEERVALVRTPAGYERNAKRFPVLYLTDGANQLGHTASTVEFFARNRRMPEMIVAITNTDRIRDLTPTNGADSDGKQLPTSGGADKFLQFLEGELIPQVEKSYRTISPPGCTTAVHSSPGRAIRSG